MAFVEGHEYSRGTKPKLIYDGLLREIKQDPIKLKRALESVLNKASEGDLAALDWIACRLEGKPTPSMIDDNGDLVPFQAIQLTVVRPQIVAQSNTGQALDAEITGSTPNAVALPNTP